MNIAVNSGSNVKTQTVGSCWPRLYRALGLVESRADDGYRTLGASVLVPRRLMRGEHLFHTNDKRTALYVVEYGSVKLYATSVNGDEQVMGFQFAGDLLGVDALGASTYGCSAMALEPTRVCALHAGVLDELCQYLPELQHQLLRLASKRVAELQEQMLLLAKKSATERLATFLVNLSRRLQVQDRTDADFYLSMSRYAIGCYLGLALETVSRILQQFQSKRLISIHGRRVRIRDYERLRLLAGVGTESAKESPANPPPLHLGRGHA